MSESANRPTVIFVTGCTASGKSGIAHRLAVDLDAEIVSVDSMKVYRGMDIGTAKATRAEQAEVRYHVIDVVDPSEAFSAARFAESAESAIADIHRRGKIIVAEGGTALYLKALSEGLFEGPGTDLAVRERLKGELADIGADAMHAKLRAVDPEAADRIHRNDERRIVRALEVFQATGQPISSMQQQFGVLRTDFAMTFVGLRHEVERLNRRINARVKQMIVEGLVDEVRALADRQPPMSEQARVALGYAELIEFFAGRGSLDDAIERIKINTRRFAKSQRTWFRRFSHVQWFDVADNTEPQDLYPAIRETIACSLSAAS